MITATDVRLAQTGDKDAFVRIINSSEKTMYRVAKSILFSDEECADAIQEAILKAYHSIEHLREPQYFKTWLIRILINVCNQMLRSREKVVSLGEWKEPPAESASYDKIEIQEAIRALEPSLRLIVTLYYYEDQSIKTIADSLNIPSGTVKSRLNRARTELAKLLKNEDTRSVYNEQF